MSDFTPIPGYPGYSISPLGRVRSERSGVILRHDALGRVRLRSGARHVLRFVGELLHAPGGAADAGGAAQPVQDARGAELERRLALARRVNGHLLALVAQLRAEIASLAKCRGKKAMPRIPADDLLLQPLNFDDELPR